MNDLHALITAQLDGSVVRCAPLVLFDFRSRPKAVWSGFGNVVAGERTWEGVRGLGTLSAISAGTSGAVDEITLSLTAYGPLLDSFKSDAEESVGRDVTEFLQFFDIRQVDEAGEPVDWAPLSDPLHLFLGRMGPLTASMSPPSTDSGQRSQTLSVSAQNAFANRGRPAFAYFSDRDQKGRGDGTDNMFVKISQFSEGTVRWPQF